MGFYSRWRALVALGNIHPVRLDSGILNGPAFIRATFFMPPLWIRHSRACTSAAAWSPGLYWTSAVRARRRRYRGLGQILQNLSQTAAESSLDQPDVRPEGDGSTPAVQPAAHPRQAGPPAAMSETAAVTGPAGSRNPAR